MHFSFVSILVIFGKSDHLTLPKRQQQQPKPGEYFMTSIFNLKMLFLHIFNSIFELVQFPMDF